MAGQADSVRLRRVRRDMLRGLRRPREALGHAQRAAHGRRPGLRRRAPGAGPLLPAAPPLLQVGGLGHRALRRRPQLHPGTRQGLRRVQEKVQGGSERRAWDSVRRHVVRADDQHYRRHRGCQERAGVPARMVRGPLLLRRLPGVDEVAGRRQAAQVHGGRGRARQGGARLRRHKPLHHLLHQAQQHRPRGPTAAQHPGGHRNHQPPYVSLSLLRSSTPPSSFSQWTNDGCWFCITAFRNGKAIGDRANSIWLYIVPSGMRSLMNYVKERYNSPPIYVTENGMDDGNSPFTSIKDALKDSKRVKYHNDYLTNLAASIKDDACDVRGYFAWSLLDNWEWTAGYSSRFGLYFVDYKDNLKRYPKSSVQWFKNLLASS
ncbi:Beta-glucosidase 11 [Zea mays]|nr:Beta-glucosidase 11 [Zea mays]